jgi:hypothetical protein
MAERLLEEEKADLIGMVRALIADPELPAKARRGKVGDIRGCTYNQLCVMRRTSGKGLACVQNPALGHEGRLGIGTLQPAAKRRNVVVVGGGPAGLAAAWTAAARGHHVTLFEAAPELGGQNRLARQVRSRARLGEATRWLIHQAARFSVNLKIGQRAGAADVLALDPEVVVLAAGSSPLRSGYSGHRPEVAEVPGVRLEHVFSVWDVFERLPAIGPHVLVYDDDPHLSALFAAEHLIDQGHTVTIATPNLHPGRGIEPAFIPDVLRRVRPKGLALSPNQLLDEIGPGWVRLRDRYAATTSVVRPIDAVILATGNRANDDLAPELAGKVEQLRLIGDCLAPAACTTPSSTANAPDERAERRPSQPSLSRIDRPRRVRRRSVHGQQRTEALDPVVNAVRTQRMPIRRGVDRHHRLFQPALGHPGQTRHRQIGARLHDGIDVGCVDFEDGVAQTLL